ncbi:ATP-binding protein [Paraburkholderia sp. A1BS-2L]|uniref:ATP-binding protein n=1 Tax=Paraburkholderia sp. A1BS-2L TaxID=3028373 RepID=UPI003DA8214C
MDEAERRFRSLADAIPHVVWTADPDGSVDFISQRLETYSGLAASQLEGWSWTEILHPDDMQSAVENWKQALSRGVEYQMEVRIKSSADGAWRWHLDRISPVKDAQGRVVKWVGTVTDIEDQKQALAAADRANRAKSDFLSSMSHELRSPLNAILGFAQLMASESPPPTPSQRASVDQILRAGWHLLELINEVLDLAKIESGQVSISPEPVLLSEALQECAAMIEPQAQQRGIRVSFPHVDAGCHVHADRTRFKQIVINLLSNAIKYNRPQGTVEVSCSMPAAERVRVSVSDTGAGLSPQQLSQLFQPFNRLGQEAGTEEGTGIGLVVARRLTELMGGAIGVESTVGCGCVFWIELNTASAPEIATLAAARSDTAGEPAAGNGAAEAPAHTVLYIEDNPANLKLVEQLVARCADMRMLSAVTGQRGVELACTALPQVIVMDINLPDISGIEALSILRRNPMTKAMPVVALSLNAMPRDIEKGLKAGFFRYLTKPIKIDQFMDALAEAVAFEAPLNKCSIAQLVQRAGVARPTFYQHFPDLQVAAQRAALVRLKNAFTFVEEQGTLLSPPNVAFVESMEMETALILEHMCAHQSFYLTVFNDAATSAFFDDLVTFVAGRILPPYEGVRTEAEEDCLTVLGGGLVWTVVRWLRQRTTRETSGVTAKRIARTSATILDAFGLTLGFARVALK